MIEWFDSAKVKPRQNDTYLWFLGMDLLSRPMIITGTYNGQFVELFDSSEMVIYGDGCRDESIALRYWAPINLPEQL